MKKQEIKALSRGENALPEDLLKAWLTGWHVCELSDSEENTIREAAEKILTAEVEWGRKCVEVKCTCRQAAALKGSLKGADERGLKGLCERHGVVYNRAVRAARLAEHERLVDEVINECRESGSIPTRTMCHKRIDAKEGRKSGKKRIPKKKPPVDPSELPTATVTQRLEAAVPALDRVLHRLESDDLEDETRSKWVDFVADIRERLDNFEGAKRLEVVKEPVEVVQKFIRLSKMVGKLPDTTQVHIAALLEEVDKALGTIRAALRTRKAA